MPFGSKTVTFPKFGVVIEPGTICTLNPEPSSLSVMLKSTLVNLSVVL